MFKDGTGALGAIMDGKKIVGQARWVPAEGGSVFMAIDPVTLAVAVAVMSINKRIDEIQETQEEILQFLHQDKESELEGSVNSLADILEQYRFNSNNIVWKSGKLTAITAIKGKAEDNVIFYRKQIRSALDKQKIVHGYKAADKLKASLGHSFKYYQLCIYITAYASFLEVLLGGNYSREYLDHMIEKIREDSTQYRYDYTECYEQLEGYMKGTVQALTFSGIGNAVRVTGKAAGKIPLIGKAPVDDVLLSAGNALKSFGSQHGKDAMIDFSNNRDAGIRLFMESIETIDQLSNEPVEIFFDQDQLYICA